MPNRNKRIAVYLTETELATVDRIRESFGDLSRSTVASVLIKQAITAIERAGLTAGGRRLAYDPTIDPADGGHTAEAYVDIGAELECVNAACPNFPHTYRKGYHVP